MRPKGKKSSSRRSGVRTRQAYRSQGRNSATVDATAVGAEQQDNSAAVGAEQQDNSAAEGSRVELEDNSSADLKRLGWTVVKSFTHVADARDFANGLRPGNEMRYLRSRDVAGGTAYDYTCQFPECKCEMVVESKQTADLEPGAQSPSRGSPVRAPTPTRVGKKVLIHTTRPCLRISNFF